MLRVGPDLAHGHLVGAMGALRWLTIDGLGACPALGGAQHDHRPARTLRGAALAGGTLDGRDLLDDGIHGGRHGLVHAWRVVSLHEVGVVAVALEERQQLRLGDARQHRGVGDLVAVEVEDGQDGAVADRVQELVGVPARGQGTGLRLAVADDAADHQVGVVEGRAVGVRERVAQLAALVDGARRLRGDVAGDAAREGELPEELPQALRVPRDARVDLRVGALEVGVGDGRRAAVAGTHDVDGVQVPGADDPVQVGVDEVQAGRRAPVAEQARLDVLGLQRLPQERVVEQVDLADGQVVGGPPVGIDEGQVGGRQGTILVAGHRSVTDPRPRRAGPCSRGAAFAAAPGPRGPAGAGLDRLGLGHLVVTSGLGACVDTRCEGP